MLSDEAKYQLLKRLDADPDISQRELAREMGVSLGKVNYCLQALVEKGLIKARNFSQSQNKRRYLYKLTPQGIEEKVRITARFLKRKVVEHEALTAEIEALRREVRSQQDEHPAKPR